jgi:hypothetical protein
MEELEQRTPWSVTRHCHYPGPTRPDPGPARCRVRVGFVILSEYLERAGRLLFLQNQDIYRVGLNGPPDFELELRSKWILYRDINRDIDRDIINFDFKFLFPC